ncbi:MAG: thiamine phosphate synthase [Lentisphaerae bacterium]|nr:thiamine phosphate synthase [Lentisphaerota bacterium]MBR2871887.1 thiamine phosphate synthase [Lentisphaeria bacterium]
MRTLTERIEIFKSSDLYPVISSEFCNGRDTCEILSGIAAAGARVVQIREKNISDCAMFELVRKCKKITDRCQMLLIVDDRLDIAMAAGADGVHLGQEDFPLPEAKKLAPGMFFGVSTHNAEEIQKALAEGCSYLNIGPVFPTRTKSVACGALGLEKAEELKKLVTCPFSVMGGIKEHHLELLCSKGFNHIAMVTEITQAPDVEAKVRQLRQIMKGC